MTKKSDVIVIGAGIGGLACGAALAKGGNHVIVLEGKDRVGGRATSIPIHGIQTGQS